MELVYLWVEEFRNIKQVGFSFSSKFKVEFKFNEKLGYKQICIEEFQNQRKLFDDKINNVTTIIGKNGSGKTNVLDLLGLRMNERKQFRDAKYFIIYHHEDNLFSIEGSNFDLVASNIEEYPNKEDSIDIVTNPFSMLIEKGNNIFRYAGFLQFNESQYNKVNVFNLRNIFRQGYTRQGFKMESDYSNFFQRIYLNPLFIGSYAKYRLITYFNRVILSETREQGFVFNLDGTVSIKVIPDVHYLSLHEVKLKLIYKRNIFKRKTNDQPLINIKEKFILEFLKKYFYYSFESYTEVVKDSGKTKKLQSELENIENPGKDRIYLLNLLKIIYSHFEKEKLDYADMENYINALNKLLTYIDRLPDKYFYENKITIPVGKEEEEAVSDLLKFIDDISLDEVDYLNNAIKISIEPMSSGEEALINIFSAMLFGIEQKRNSKNEKAIILMDEPDVFMHPEWSRVFLSEVFNFLRVIEDGYHSYQLVVTTHSPFIVSDLPKDNIITIEKNLDNGLCEIVQLNNQEQTFASNIHSLLSNKFFMNSTMGEFARGKIDHVIKTLNNKSNSELTVEEKKQAKEIIDIVGEPLLKNKLNEMYLLKTREYKKKILKEQIESLNQELRMLELDEDD